MSLILEGFALAIEGAALVIDCACCIKELCDRRACLTDNDCDEAALQPGAECFCRGNKCTSNPACVDDDDCPDGLVCVDGRCVPPCRGQECTGDADCPEGCVCIESGCWDPELVYYCWKQVQDEQGNPIPDADQEVQCKQGVPTPPMYSSAGGPYLSYALCAATGCDSMFSCNTVVGDCYPDPLGPYDSFSDCQAACGEGGDLGRCCKSTVCYDAEGNVESVSSTCDDCCGGQKVPIDPDFPGLGERCDNTSLCRKSDCISDDPIAFPGCRTFRQFNTLFRDCDLCPTDAVGPCCHEDTNPESATFGKDICTLQDEAYCTEILNGDFKGNMWWTCTEPRTDIGQDFACPNCNGNGDCSCEEGEFCFANRCNSCENPNDNPTKTGTVTEVRFDDYTTIDPDPQLYRKYYFRVLTCQGQVVEDLRREPVVIYGRNINTPDRLDQLIIVDNDPNIVDSRGYTTYEDEECYLEIVAKKPDGTPPRIGLCYFWQDPPVINGICQYEPYTCECNTGEPDFECPNCQIPPDILLYETYNWAEITPQQGIPQEGQCFTVNGCAQRWFNLSTKKWFRETWEYCFFDENTGAETTYSRRRDRLIVLMPDGTLQDKTDEWVTGLPVRANNVDYSDCLIRGYGDKCLVYNEEEGGCEVNQTENGSDVTTDEYGGYAPPAAPPDPLGNCIINRNLTDPNPLP